MIKTIIKIPFVICFILCIPLAAPIYLMIALGEWAFEKDMSFKEALRWGIES